MRRLRQLSIVVVTFLALLSVCAIPPIPPGLSAIPTVAISPEAGPHSGRYLTGDTLRFSILIHNAFGVDTASVSVLDTCGSDTSWRLTIPTDADTADFDGVVVLTCRDTVWIKATVRSLEDTTVYCSTHVVVGDTAGPPVTDIAVSTQRTDVGHVMISWNAVTGATFYVVYRSASRTSGYAQLTTVTTLTHIDATNVDYYYYAVARSSSGLSVGSDTSYAGGNAPKWRRDTLLVSGVETRSIAVPLADSCVNPTPDPLRFDLLGGMPGSDSLDSAGTYFFTPGYADSGTYAVRIQARAGLLRDTLLLLVRVANLNQAPVFSNAPFTMNVPRGDSATSPVALLAVDTTDHDSLIYTVCADSTHLPQNARARVDNASRLVVAAPATADTGSTFRIAVVASDGHGGADTLFVAIAVFDPTAEDRTPPSIAAAVANPLPGASLRDSTASLAFVITDANRVHHAVYVKGVRPSDSTALVLDGTGRCSFILQLAKGKNLFEIVAFDSSANRNRTVLPCSLTYAVTKPQILQNPRNADIVKGDAATFSVMLNADVNPRPTYRWYNQAAPTTTLSTDSVFTISAVAYAQEGSYAVIVSNAEGRDTSNAAALTVVDATKPIITVIGSVDTTVLLNSSYSDPGATASDDRDGNISASVVRSNPVNIAAVGRYTVTYDVSDAAGNAAVRRTRVVRVEGWEEIGRFSGDRYMATYSMDVDAQGVAYFAYIDSSLRVRVRSYANGQWLSIDNGAGFPTDSVSRVKIVVGNDNKPYVMVTFHYNTYSTYIYGFSTIWTQKASLSGAEGNDIAAGSDGSVYCAYVTSVAEVERHMVAEVSQGSARLLCSDSGLQQQYQIYFPMSLSVSPADSLYMTIGDGPVTVLVLRNGEWDYASQDTIVIGEKSRSAQMAFSPQGTPYIACAQGEGSRNPVVKHLSNGRWVASAPEVAGECNFEIGFDITSGNDLLLATWCYPSFSVFKSTGGVWTPVPSSGTGLVMADASNDYWISGYDISVKSAGQTTYVSAGGLVWRYVPQ